MNITELRYLVAIRKWGSVSAAAKQLYAAQPNVSKALKNLEEEYGIRIFERSSTRHDPHPNRDGTSLSRPSGCCRRWTGWTLTPAAGRASAQSCGWPCPHATYASYAAVDFLQQAAGSEQLRCTSGRPVPWKGWTLCCAGATIWPCCATPRRTRTTTAATVPGAGLHREQIMEFEYRLLVNRDSPLARHEVHDLAELNRYTEVLHDDFQLPGEEGSSLRWQVNENRRVHVYERCSQFSILQSLPTAYMVASPMPQRALEQYHLVLKKCPAQNQRMRDVLVYPDKGGLRPEEEKFIELLRRQAALTVK